MATKTFEELKQLAIQIRDEKTNKQNTATRVGTEMLEHLNKLEQDYYDKTTINNRTSEYNVSINHPTSGISSSNKYDLSSAIAQVPAELRSSGLTVSFLNADGNTEKWEFAGGSWTASGFSQMGAGKIKNIENNTPHIDNSGYDFEITDENGFVIARFKDGGIILKRIKVDKSGIIRCYNDKDELVFDSSNITFDTDLSVKDGNIDFEIIDESGFFAILQVIDGYIKTKNFDGKEITLMINSIGERLKDLEGNTQQTNNEVDCWGNSLTQSSGYNKLYGLDKVLSFFTEQGFDTSKMTNGLPYPSVLQELLGQTFKVNNFGIASDNVYIIGMRNGALPMAVQKEFTLPASNTETVQIGSGSGGADAPLCVANTAIRVQTASMGSADGYKVYCKNIPCMLNKDSSSQFTLKRINASETPTIIRKGTEIYGYGVDYRCPKVAIFFIYYNGKWDTVDELIKRIKQIVEYTNAENYIVVGPHFGTTGIVDDTDAPYDPDGNTFPDDPAQAEQFLNNVAKMKAEFGGHFLDWGYYVSHYALEDFGYTPITDDDLTPEQKEAGVVSDVYQMDRGGLPTTFWRFAYGVDGASSNDSTHMNAAGYAILAYRIYLMIKELLKQ